MQKERLMEENYNPVIHSKKQYNNLNYYLRQSLQEELDNQGNQKIKEGFSKHKFQGKREYDLDSIDINSQKSLRPMTALLSPSYGYSQRIRPITAPGLKVQVKHMMKIDENKEMVSVPYHSETMYQTNQEKFEKTYQNVLRNHASLKKVSLGGESEIYNVDGEQPINQNINEKQIIKNGQSNAQQGQVIQQINERENDQLTEGTKSQQRLFKHSSLQMYDNLVDIMKLINGQTCTKSPVIVKTKHQGLRPQSAVNKQQKVNQRYRPMSGRIQSIAVRGFQL